MISEECVCMFVTFKVACHTTLFFPFSFIDTRIVMSDTITLLLYCHVYMRCVTLYKERRKKCFVICNNIMQKGL